MENFQQPSITNERNDDNMKQERIKQIAKDIKNYEEAIENAEGALAEAERELVDALNDAYSE
jgi:F0F1-type ATP synthase membrane subunit b/b'